MSKPAFSYYVFREVISIDSVASAIVDKVEKHNKHALLLNMVNNLIDAGEIENTDDLIAFIRTELEYVWGWEWLQEC